MGFSLSQKNCVYLPFLNFKKMFYFIFLTIILELLAVVNGEYIYYHILLINSLLLIHFTFLGVLLRTCQDICYV